MAIQVDAAAKAASEIERITTPEQPVSQTLKRNEQLVYDELRQSKAPLKAYELLEALQDHGLRAPMTIYRALEALIAKGHIKKIASLNAFVAVRESGATRARAFLICRECMQAKEITLDETQVADLFSPLLIDAGEVIIEAFGQCHQVCVRPGKIAR